MKTIFTASLLLIISSQIKAGQMYITANGEINPSQITLSLNQSANIGLWSSYDYPQGAYYMGIVNGGHGSLNINSTVIHYPGESSVIRWEEDIDGPEVISDLMDYFNIQNQIICIALVDSRIPIDTLNGQLVSGITFISSTAGNTNLMLFDSGLNILDYQSITITPEPATILLFALGGIALRRKR